LNCAESEASALKKKISIIFQYAALHTDCTTGSFNGKFQIGRDKGNFQGNSSETEKEEEGDVQLEVNL